MGLAWGFGYFFTKTLFEKHQQVVNSLPILFLGLFISSFIGAKVFFLWFSSGPKLYQYLYANYFWLGGGFVFYGGLIFGLIYYFTYSLLLKKFDFSNSHLLLPGLIFGHAIGRVGCLLTGCCFGSLTDVPWAVSMSGELRHPVQAYEAILLFIIGVIILKMINLKKKNLLIISTYLISYSIVRFLLEYLRGDEVRGIFLNHLSTSQIVSIFLLGIGFLFLSKSFFVNVKSRF